jgi:3-carboxy-cis,cis-muconate cycloisomerase
LLRHLVRLGELRSRVLVLQFGGAAGTLASLGSSGIAVASALAKELELSVPSLPWHSNRDRIAEVATFHGLLAGSLGKIGRDISLCMQTEVAEMSEPTEPGRGNSSTMPHKCNPVGSAVLLATAVRIPGLVSTILTAMIQEHERGLGGWQAEWETLPEICSLTLGALERAASLTAGLNINSKAIERNLRATNGLLLAESVSMRLAPFVGRDKAHSLVEAASRRASDEGTPFIDALLQIREISDHLDRAVLDESLDSDRYLGSSKDFIHSVLEEYSILKMSNREVR